MAIAFPLFRPLGSALLRLLMCALALNATQAQEQRVNFNNSVRPLPAPVAATQRAVQAERLADEVEFAVSLQLRSYPRMQERIARGEIISRQELEQVHLPLPQDYDAVVQWLTAQGLTVTRQDPSRLLVFAKGTVTQVQDSLQVHFVTVTANGTTYHTADTSPSLPLSIATPVLGINHLQPFLQRRKHSQRRPLINNVAPFKVSEILKAYNGTNLGVTGAGQKIAILIDTTAKNSDLTAFWANNGVAQSTANIENINVNGGTLPTASGEETMDVEWTSGIAPGAKIRVYASGSLSDADLDASLQRIINDLPTQPQLHQLSISLGLGETYITDSQFATDAQLFATLASGGVSIFVSSGDDGSTPSDQSDSTGPLQVESYASDVSVTGVGGTSLVLNTSTGVRTGESAWSGSGGGLSIKANRPSWQTGNGVPAGSKRCVPDVCLAADPNTGAYVYLNGAVETIGGTSWSAPVWAGFCALVNQARANQSLPPLGLMNPSLYPLIGTNNFYDITSGTNSHTNVGPNAGKYAASAGFDLVTGIGAPNMANLLTTLASLAPPVPTITSFTPASGVQNTTVIITGTNFGSASLVAFNGTSASFTVDSSAQITATSPVGATTGPLTVTTPGGLATSSGNFTVIAGPPAPSITGFSPAYGIPGTTITVSGLNFTNTTAVKFNGTAAASFSVVSTASLTAVVPAGATSGTIQLTTPSGTATSTATFTMLSGDGSPTLSSFTPASGSTGATVTLDGTNFVGVSSVQFNGTNTIFSVISPTQLSAILPAGATTGVITVVTGLGTATSATSFTVVTAATSPVVISQIFGGGGNTGAPYANDFVELYNRSAAAVDLSGWSVQYASRTGTNWGVIALAGTMPPGKYYLIKAAGGTSGAALPTPDATSTAVNFGSTGGKVALLNGATAIASGTSSPVGLPALVDFVGYGATDAYEGTGPTIAISATTAAFRLGAGATDTGDNAADFATATPAPRNAATGGGGGGLPDLIITKSHVSNFTQNDTGRTYTITVTNAGTADTVGTVNVTDTLPAGLTATAISGSGWTTSLTSLNASRTDVLAAGASYPVLTITVNVASNAAATVTNSALVAGGGESATGNNTATDPTTIVPAVVGNGGVVISQIYGAGGTAGASFQNDFIELYNAGNSSVSLVGWSVQYASSTGTTWTNRINLSGTIQPGRYFLISGASSGSVGSVLPTADVIGTVNLSGSNGKVALVNTTTALTGSNPVGTASVIDFVGYGNANAYEGTAAAPTPSASNAIFRAGNGTVDTNQNGSDFASAAVNPRNANTNTSLTPIETWRVQYFGSPANSGPGADTGITAGDGVTNLMKYALDLIPSVPATTDSKVTFDITTGYLRLTIAKNPNATDLTFQVESSTSLDPTASWSTSSIVVDTTTSSLLQAHDTHALAESHRFLRLKVIR